MMTATAATRAAVGAAACWPPSTAAGSRLPSPAATLSPGRLRSPACHHHAMLAAGQMCIVERAMSKAPSTPSQRVLLGPGPSDVPARVLAALAMPTLGHLDPEYLAIMDETRTLLQQVFGTHNRLNLASSGTASAGW